MLIDAFQPGMHDRAAFLEMREAGIGAVTVNCGYWEDATESLDNLARWRDLLRENQDIAVIARTAAEIEQAERDGKLAVLLGFQNVACLQGRIRFVEFFAELGISIVQLTYNNQTEAGSSCYENDDGGLTRFGRQLVPELNRCGVLIDLSHVGEKTALDTVALSERPVGVTHAAAGSLFAHRRNKSDALLRALASRGGVLGCALYPNLIGEHFSASLQAWCTMIARTVDIMGVGHVGIGTGRRYKGTPDQLDWARMGRWTRRKDYGAAGPGRSASEAAPAWAPEVRDLAQIETGLREIGFNEAETKLILRENWVRVFRETLGRPVGGDPPAPAAARKQ